jgi:phosphotransferase system HPr (HPr) family protein
MPDKYFIERIAELRANMRDRSQSLTNLVAEPDGKQYVDPLNSIADIREALVLAEKEASNNHIIETSVPLINSAILSKYHAHARVEIKNAQFERAENLVKHYNNLSCQAYFKNSSKEIIFNAKHLKPWKKLGISEGDILEIYAHDLGGNSKRAKNLVVENMLRLLGDERSEEDPYAHYVHREVEVLAPHGLHARPSALVVKAASIYPGEVFIVYNGKNLDAKSIMILMTSEITQGEKIQIAYEPDCGGNTSEVHNLMKAALETEE